MTEVSAKVGKDGEVHKVDYPLLDANDTASLIKNFGEEVVVAHTKSSITVALQSFVRGLIKGNKSKKEIAEAVAKWKPGVRTPGKSKMEKVTDMVGSMSAEERADLLKKLQGKK